MRNPWIDTPLSAPFVLGIDKEYVNAHNVIHDDHPELQIDLRLPPAPFFGLHNAPVVVLLANPGVHPDGVTILNEPANLKLIMDSITSPRGKPFVDLSSAYNIPDKAAWWKEHTRDLAKIVGGYDELSKKILAIDLHGYHSQKWSAPKANFPSQAYSFHLVRQAMERGALIITARCREYWLASVPELISYENVVEKTLSPRAVHLSENNLKEKDFAKVVKALTQK